MDTAQAAKGDRIVHRIRHESDAIILTCSVVMGLRDRGWVPSVQNAYDLATQAQSLRETADFLDRLAKANETYARRNAPEAA